MVNIIGGAGIEGFYDFKNYGTVTWISGDLQSGLRLLPVQIDNYGLWDAKTNNTIYGAYSGGGTTTFNNYGTFRKSGGAGGQTSLDSATTFNNYGTLDVQSGGLGISVGTGSGVFNVASNSVIGFGGGLNGEIPYVLTGSPTFSGLGLVNGKLAASNAVVNGTLALFNAYLGGTLTIASNAVVNLIGSSVFYSSVVFNTLLLTNYGTVNWNGTDLQCEASPQIYNYGLWDAQTNNTFYGAYSGGGITIFNNYGTFRKSSGNSSTIPNSTFLDNNTTFNNYGTLDDQAGVMDISGGSGSGIFNTASNSVTFFVINFNYTLTKYTLTGNPTFTGAGIVQGNLTGNNAVIGGALNYNSGALSGTLTIASNAFLNLVGIPGQPVAFQGTILTNYGTVNWNGNLYSQSSPQIYNYGLWDAQTNNTFDGNFSGVGATTFNNYGTFRKSGGNSNSGQTILDSYTTFNNPGTLDVQIGLMNLGGSYTLAGGTLNFGINSSYKFGSINLGGFAARAGRLSVNLNNNYSPAAGGSFALLGYGSETGVFTATSLPHLSGLIWQTNYGATVFTVSVTNVPAPQLTSAATQNGGTISVSWDALAGQTYQFQSTTNLAPANWVNLGDVISGTNGTMTASDVIGFDLQRFYRLVVLP